MEIYERAFYLRRHFKGWLHNGWQPIDERCYCGHKRSEHGERFDIGHGPCLVPGCLCPQFTWEKFIYEQHGRCFAWQGKEK